MPREPESFESAVAESISEWLHRYMPAVAESLGPLPDTVIPSQREKLERWNLRTREVPPEMTDQLADEAVKLLAQEYQGRGEPLPDVPTLSRLVAARLNAVLYPYRADVYGVGNPRPQERVKEAERYARLAQKQQESAPPPSEPPAAPTLPEAASATPDAAPPMLANLSQQSAAAAGPQRADATAGGGY